MRGLHRPPLSLGKCRAWQGIHPLAGAAPSRWNRAARHRCCQRPDARSASGSRRWIVGSQPPKGVGAVPDPAFAGAESGRCCPITASAGFGEVSAGRSGSPPRFCGGWYGGRQPPVHAGPKARAQVVDDKSLPRSHGISREPHLPGSCPALETDLVADWPISMRGGWSNEVILRAPMVALRVDPAQLQ